MKKSYKIAVIPGDGTGPEVIAEGLKVLKVSAAKFNFSISHALIANKMKGGWRGLKGFSPNTYGSLSSKPILQCTLRKPVAKTTSNFSTPISQKRPPDFF